MNTREAVAVQGLLDWVLSLRLFEVDPDRVDLTDEEIIRLIGVLADRSHAALGAGVGQGDAIVAAVRLFGLGGAPTQARPPVASPNRRRDWEDDDVPPNAGSSS